jgi:hypothetical protein
MSRTPGSSSTCCYELIWQHRFLYRDLNDLLSKNRRLETHFQTVLARKQEAMQRRARGLKRGGALKIDPREAEPVATSMVVLLTYWLSYRVREATRATRSSPSAPARR